MTPIEKIICAEPQGVISFAGAGGKTSLMFHLAALLVLSGHRVLTTTTTKIFVPTPEQSDSLFVESDPQAVLRLSSACCKCSPHVTAAAEYLADSGKLTGFAVDDIDVFQKSGLFDWILVEADGAAGRSLKAPAGHEPVIPLCTTVLVAVAGLDVLGRPFSEDSVFRSVIAGKIMGLAEGEAVTEQAIVRLFSHPAGSFKGAPAGARRLIFLNKADDVDRVNAGERIAGRLRRAGTVVAETLIIGQTLDRIRVHSLHELEQKS